MGSDGKEVSMDRLKNGYLVQVGEGQYRVALGNRQSPQYVQSEKGGAAYVLDLKKLAPILMRRRPDLFLGAQ